MIEVTQLMDLNDHELRVENLSHIKQLNIGIFFFLPVMRIREGLECR